MYAQPIPNPVPTGLAIFGVGAVGVATGALIAHGVRMAMQRSLPAPAPKPGPKPSGPVRGEEQPEPQVVTVSAGIPWLYRATPWLDGWIAWVQSPRGATSQLPDLYAEEGQALSAAEDHILSMGGFPLAKWPGEEQAPVPVLAPGKDHHVYLERFYHLALPRRARSAVSTKRGPGPRLSDISVMLNDGPPLNTAGIKVFAVPAAGSETIDVTFYSTPEPHPEAEIDTFTFVVSAQPWWSSE